MKLELANFFEKASLVDGFCVETAVPKLAKMMRGYDEIIYTKPMEYHELYDALIWLGRLNDYGKKMTLSDETIKNMLKPFEEDKLKNDRWLVIAEWIIRLTQKL